WTAPAHCRPGDRPLDPTHTPGPTGPHEARDRGAIPWASRVARLNVDTRAPHDLGQAGRAGDVAAQFALQLDIAASEPRTVAETVRIAVGEQAQTRGRADLDERDRSAHARQRKRQRRAAQRLVRLSRARGALGDDALGVRADEGPPFGIATLAGSEHAGDGEHDGRLPVRRRQRREDVEDLVVARDPRGPFPIDLAPSRRLACGEALVSCPGLIDIAHPSILPEGLRRVSRAGIETIGAA